MNIKSSLARYVRSGHISMTPPLAPGVFMSALFSKQKLELEQTKKHGHGHRHDKNKNQGHEKEQGQEHEQEQDTDEEQVQVQKQKQKQKQKQFQQHEHKNNQHHNNQSIYPFSDEAAEVITTYNGSAALFQATQHLGLAHEHKVLLPAYCCGAEIGPFEIAGCQCVFFDVDENLNADYEAIKRFFESDEKPRALLVTHYFGIAQRDIENIRTLCWQHQVALVEDCAHALHCQHNNNPLGSFGELAIFSPRKSLPLTEGGLCVYNPGNDQSQLINTRALSDTELSPPHWPPLLQRACYSIQQYYRSQARSHTIGILCAAIPASLIKVFKKFKLFKNSVWLTADAEGDKAIPIYTTSMSNLMLRIFNSTEHNFVVETRKRNFNVWLSELDTVSTPKSVRPLFKQLPDGCSPLYFPIVTESPSALVSFLAEEDVEAFNWWQHQHPSVDWENYPIATQLKSSIVALPVHQGLDKPQIQRMATIVKRFATTNTEL